MVMAADRSAPAGVSTADMAASQAPFTASRAHICHVLSSLSQQRASATVTVCGPRRRTGRQLAADVAAMGEALSTELGVQRGERVCILGLNSDMYCDALLAVALIGAIPAPLNHRWSLSEAVAAAEGVQPTVLVLDAAMAHWWPQLRAAVPSLRCTLLLPAQRATTSGTREGPTVAPSSNGSPSQAIQGRPDDSNACVPGSRDGGKARAQAGAHSAPDVHSWRDLRGRYTRKQHGLRSGEPVGAHECGLPLQWATDSPRAPAIICFTSGTTGRPKGAVLSHEALTFQSLAKLATVGYSQADVFLHVAPLCHIGGISSLLAMLMAGGTSVFAASFSASHLPPLIAEHGITALIAVPAMLADVIRAQERGECCSFPCVRTLLVGGGAMSRVMQHQVESLFPRSQLWTAYGMTEASSSITFHCLRRPQGTGQQDVGTLQSLQEPADSSSSSNSGAIGAGACSGVPAPHVEISISSSDRKGPGDTASVGEVLTRGPHLMSGYWGMPEATAAVLTAEGWFRTGDLGRIDSHGVLWLVGRAKDMIKSGGENVFAPEVEAVLCQHPGVEEAAVVGTLDPRLGESVAALLRLRPGWRWEDGRCHAPGTPGEGLSGVREGHGSGVPPASPSSEDTRPLTADSLAEFCRQSSLSRFKVPRHFVALGSGEQLPKTSTGKVRKDDVRLVLQRLRNEEGGVPVARL